MITTEKLCNFNIDNGEIEIVRDFVCKGVEGIKFSEYAKCREVAIHENTAPGFRRTLRN